MKRFSHIGGALALAVGLFTAVCGYGEVPPAGTAQRIVSLSPSATEMVYTLGLDDRLAGVTRYCLYPPEARTKEKVGGLFDVNYETLYKLRPDLVILSEGAVDQKQRLTAMGIASLELETKSIDGILRSIDRMGILFDRKDQAAKLVGHIRGKIDRVRDKTKDLPRPRVVITFLRPLGTGAIREVYIAGDDTFLNDVLEIAGGVNAYKGNNVVTSPVVSPEGILHLDPDIIIELITNLDESGLSPEEVAKDWDMLSELKAYQDHHIYVLGKRYLGIPGPRVGEVIDEIARLVHPESAW